VTLGDGQHAQPVGGVPVENGVGGRGDRRVDVSQQDLRSALEIADGQCTVSPAGALAMYWRAESNGSCRRRAPVSRANRPMIRPVAARDRWTNRRQATSTVAARK
jgi:hypothetical protein